jgi:uncharacterized membrane protein
MTQIYRIVFVLSWVLGVVSILAAVVIKLLLLEPRAMVTGHTLFIVAGTFFLCALATREMQRSSSP